jgi:hypothetical protein
MPIQVNAPCGSHIEDVFTDAFSRKLEYGDYAYFDFNGIEVRVNQSTDYALLMRDRDTAYLLGWKVIGPDPVDEYSDELLEEIGKTTLKREEECLAQQLEYEKEQAVYNAIALEAMSKYGYYMYPSFTDEYQSWKDAQSDGYGKAVFDLVERTAAISVMLSSQRNTHIKNVFEEASNIASESLGGCTGFQWGGAKQILSRYWLYSDCM